MRKRPDASNGDAYDPSYRAAVYDYTPKHAANHKCAPYYPSDDHREPTALTDPNAYYDHHRALTDANGHAIVNTAPYQSRHDWSGDRMFG